MGMGIRARTLALITACAGTTTLAPSQVSLSWEYTSATSQYGIRDLAWSAAGGLLFTNSARGGAEIESLLVGGGLTDPRAWSSGPVDGDRLGRTSTSLDGRVTASVYRQDPSAGSTTPSTLALRIASGVPMPAVVTVASTIPSPLFDTTSYGVSVLGDGSCVRVWGYSLSEGKCLLQTYDASGAWVETQQITIGGRAYGAASSADGAVLAIQGATSTQIVCVGASPGNHWFSQPGYVQGAVTSIPSGNLLAWASSFGEVRLARRQADGSFQEAIDFDTNPIGRCSAIALSDDGSTLALGLNDVASSITVRMQVYDLGPNSATLRFDHAIPTTGVQYATVTSIDAGPRGELIAFGNSGDFENTIPELSIYRRTTAGAYGPQSEWSAQLAGSAMRVELDPLGDRLAVLRTGGHMNSNLSSWATMLYDLGTDIRLVGAAHVGQSVELRIAANPAQRLVVYRSSALSSPAANLGAMGVLHLASPVVMGGAVGGPSGTGNLAILLASTLYPIGSTHHFQALRLNPRRLTSSVASFTVAP